MLGDLDQVFLLHSHRDRKICITDVGLAFTLSSSLGHSHLTSSKLAIDPRKPWNTGSAYSSWQNYGGKNWTEMTLTSNNLCLIVVKTNLHTVCNIQQSVTRGSNDKTHRLSRRTAATTRFRPETDGAKLFANDPIRWAATSQAFTRWRHQAR